MSKADDMEMLRSAMIPAVYGAFLMDIENGEDPANNPFASDFLKRYRGNTRSPEQLKRHLLGFVGKAKRYELERNLERAESIVYNPAPVNSEELKEEIADFKGDLHKDSLRSKIAIGIAQGREQQVSPYLKIKPTVSDGLSKLLNLMTKKLDELEE